MYGSINAEQMTRYPYNTYDAVLLGEGNVRWQTLSWRKWWSKDRDNAT
jgi:hypothetical protein